MIALRDLAAGDPFASGALLLGVFLTVIGVGVLFASGLDARIAYDLVLGAAIMILAVRRLSRRSHDHGDG
jgi:hypothetical protein